MPASIRIIKIVKDPISQEEAYIVEFECETEHPKDLMRELSSSPMGQRVINLLNKAEFIPEFSEKTADELKIEAEEEEKARKEREEELRTEGRNETASKYEEVIGTLPIKIQKKFEQARNNSE